MNPRQSRLVLPRVDAKNVSPSKRYLIKSDDSKYRVGYFSSGVFICDTGEPIMPSWLEEIWELPQ